MRNDLARPDAEPMAYRSHRGLDPPLSAAVGEGLGSRLPVMLITSFGALALLLASVGVYAMFAIAGLMLRQAPLGWPPACRAAVRSAVRLLRGWLHEVPPFDTIALGGAVAVLMGCATVALLIPVRGATRVDPVVALHAE